MPLSLSLSVSVCGAAEAERCCRAFVGVKTIRGLRDARVRVLCFPGGADGVGHGGFEELKICWEEARQWLIDVPSASGRVRGVDVGTDGEQIVVELLE